MELQKATNSWNNDEVQSLLNIWSENEIQVAFESSTRNDKVYKKISLRLAELDICHSAKQCREKIKKLKQDYKKIKAYNNRSGSKKRISKWYEKLDAILGHKPAYSIATDANGSIEMESIKKIWTNEEVRTLINIWSEDDIQKEFESATRVENVYEKINSRLEELGIYQSVQQCRGKIKKMKHEYKKMKDRINMGGSNSGTCEWFDALDAVLGQRPEYSGGPGSKDSATDLLEDVKDDNIEYLSTVEHVQPTEPSFMDSPTASSSHCPASPPEINPRRLKRKRKTDSDFLEAMVEMEEVNREILRQGNEQRERYLQLLLEHDAQDAEVREREFAIRQEQAEEAREARLQQHAFQQGFLAVLDRLVQVLDKNGGPTHPPLD